MISLCKVITLQERLGDTDFQCDIDACSGNNIRKDEGSETGGLISAEL